LLFLYQLQVRRHNDSGNYEDASNASKKACLYVKIGVMIGSISWVASGFFSTVLVIVGNVLSAAATVQQAAAE